MLTELHRTCTVLNQTFDSKPIDVLQRALTELPKLELPGHHTDGSRKVEALLQIPIPNLTPVSDADNKIVADMIKKYKLHKAQLPAGKL
jgi:hypothetical protein